MDKRKVVGRYRCRSQFYNRKRKRWVKFNPKTKKVISVKQTRGPYKRVAKRKKPQKGLKW